MIYAENILKYAEIFKCAEHFKSKCRNLKAIGTFGTIIH